METKIEDKTSEELGLILQQQYEQLFAIQNNIKIISKELGDRLSKKNEEINQTA